MSEKISLDSSDFYYICNSKSENRENSTASIENKFIGQDKDGIICCPCLCFLFPHFLSAKRIFPLIRSIQNQKLWKIRIKR